MPPPLGWPVTLLTNALREIFICVTVEAQRPPPVCSALLFRNVVSLM